jgi:hypothetical protein
MFGRKAAKPTGGVEPWVEVTRADGRSEKFPCDRDRLIIGSGPAAHLRISDAAEVAPVHLMLLPRDNGCWVASARSAQIKPTVAGRPIESELLPWGTEIDIGSVCIRPQRRAADGSGRRRRLALLAVLAALWGSEFLGQPQHEFELHAGAMPSPDLFAGVARKGCASTGNPTYQAEEARDEGESLRVRYRYEPIRGIEAVRALRHAAACFTAAGDLISAAEVEREALRLQKRVEEDFRDLEIAHTKAVQDKDFVTVQRLSRSMLAFLDDANIGYRTWLEGIIRQVSASLEKKPKDKPVFSFK